MDIQTFILPAIFAFVLTGGMSLIALKLFPKLGLMDRPKKYGLRREPIPYYGGILIYIGFVVSVLLFVELDAAIIGLLVGATLLAGVSFIDDYCGLSPWLRLFVQIFAALILVGVGIGIQTH